MITQHLMISVLTNDSDMDGKIDPASVQVVGNPGHGTVAHNSDGTLTYSVSGDFSGTDTFTYTVADTQGAVSDPATVTVTVPASAGTPGKSGGGGGGGAVDLAVLLGILGLLRLRTAKRVRSA